MNRRIYLLIIVLLFGGALWALISSFEQNTSQNPAPPSHVLTPQPAQQ